MKMLHDRLQILIEYVAGVVAGMSTVDLLPPSDLTSTVFVSGSAKKDHTSLRALSALIASLPSSEHKEFRQEFDQVCTIT